MTGTTRSSDGLDDRRKRLLFRCWHRGTREMDLILGRFADVAITALTDEELGTLERLIPDPSGEPSSFPDTVAMQQKFLQLARPVLKDRADRFADAILSLDKFDRIDGVTSLARL